MSIENLTDHILVDLSVQIAFADGKQSGKIQIASLSEAALPGQRYNWEAELEIAETEQNDRRPNLTFFDGVGPLNARDDRPP